MKPITLAAALTAFMVATTAQAADFGPSAATYRDQNRQMPAFPEASSFRSATGGKLNYDYRHENG